MVNIMSIKRVIAYLSILAFMAGSIFKIIDICILNNKSYKQEYENITNRLFTGSKAPRGRILDINGKVLVDNIGVKTIFYNKVKGITKLEEIELANTLASYLEISDSLITVKQLKAYYLVTHDDGRDLITSEEYDLLSKKKITKQNIQNLKLERITDEMLNTLTTEESKASYIYYQMNKDYSFDSKVIKKEASDKEMADVCSQNLRGISCGMTWKRTYPYGNVLRAIFGNISIDGVPKELKEYYDERGIAMNSSVGVSYLELEYDSYLRGKDEVLTVDQFGNVSTISEYEKGADYKLRRE